MKIISLILLSIFLVPGASAQTSYKEREYNAIQKLMSSTKDLSNSYLFCRSSTACKALAMGNKQCGGPSDYVIVSVNNRNYEEIKYLAYRTKIREKKYNEQYGDVSDCEYVERPVSKCISNRCIEVAGEADQER